MITQVTTSPNSFNAVCGDEWRNYFNTYAANQECRFLEISNNNTLFVIPFTHDGSVAIINGKAFVGGFASNLGYDGQYTDYLVCAFEKLLKLGFTSIQHKQLPAHFGMEYGFSSWGKIPGFTSLEVFGETSIVNFTQIDFSQLRLRLLKRAQSALKVKKVSNKIECSMYWKFLTDGLQGRDLSFLPEERVLELVKDFAHRYTLYGVHSDNVPVSTILVDRYRNTLRLANYYSSRGSEHRGAFELFIHWLRSNTDSTFLLDFGSSRDPSSGQIVQSILDFKASFGARQIETVVRNFSKI